MKYLVCLLMGIQIALILYNTIQIMNNKLLLFNYILLLINVSAFFF